MSFTSLLDGFSFRKAVSAILMTLLVLFSNAQSVSDVLKKGVKVKNDEYIFLTSIGDKLNYFIGENNQRFKWQELNDNDVIFLSKSKTIPILLVPYNPLKISYDAQVTQ